jgi:coatomer protein complex subunit epsilon
MLLSAGQTKEALQLVYNASTMEQGLQALQIYLKLDRIDLARQALEALSAKDEDSILAQLGSVYLNLALGSSGAADAIHALNSLSEQYGSSPLLLNLMACALLQQGDYAGAEDKLLECLREHASDASLRAETLVNLICAGTHQQKGVDEHVRRMQAEHPDHPFCAGLGRVTSAFEREAVKYKV